ncbi:MAG: AIR synthase-related protein, partial [Nitrososphaerales archaeon]
HAVHISANDVATSGIMPDSLNVVSMFPPGTKRVEITSLMREVRKTAEELGITVAGGHTELTPGLGRPIIVITCFGSGNKFVTAGNARSGDSILMTKTAGIEGTSILAGLPKIQELISSSAQKRGASLIRKLSVVPEASLAFSTGLVHAMHDVTEGGVVGAVFEMSLASDLGFELELKQVPVNHATLEITRVLGVDPLKLIGSGSLLIACKKSSERKIIQTLRSNKIQCAKIGKFVSKSKDRLMIRGGRRVVLKEKSIQDELWPVLRKFRD